MGSTGMFTRAMLAAAGGLLAYLDHVGRGKLPLLLPPVAREGQAHLAMDEATRASLEVLVSSQGTRRGSLIEAVDRCVTGAGARQLADDLSAPLTDAAAIEARLALVQWLHDDPLLRDDLRAVLRALPDVGRALGRVVAGRGSPRDLGQLRDGLSEARRLRDHLLRRADRPALLDELLPLLGGHGALVDLYARALVPAPPTERSQGGFIAEGYDHALDALRAAVSSGLIDAICSDHQPHEIDAKTNPLPQTEPGISALETLLPLSLRLVHDGLLTPLALAQRLAGAPAGILGLAQGGFELGARADLCLIDPTDEWQLDGRTMLSVGRNTPFIGHGFRGRAAKVWRG